MKETDQDNMAFTAQKMNKQVRRFNKMSRRGNNWAYAEVIDLLDIWGEEKMQKLLQSSYRNMDTFQVIASEMAKRGHERTAQECRTKTKTMRRDYKKARDSTLVGGRITCPFYEQLDRILAGDSRRLQNGSLPEESSADTSSPCPPGEGPVPGVTEDYSDSQDPFSPCPQRSVELSDSATPSPMFYTTRASALKPTSITWPAANPTLAPSSVLLRDYEVLPSEENLARPLKRQRKTRNNLVMELSRIADRRVQTATDRILSSLNRYASADLQDRERDRADTAQIIAIMHRQTELLESLVQMQSTEQMPNSSVPSRHPRPRPTVSPPSRSGIARRTFIPRVNHRRKPQKYSS